MSKFIKKEVGFLIILSLVMVNFICAPALQYILPIILLIMIAYKEPKLKWVWKNLREIMDRDQEKEHRIILRNLVDNLNAKVERMRTFYFQKICLMDFQITSLRRKFDEQENINAYNRGINSTNVPAYASREQRPTATEPPRVAEGPASNTRSSRSPDLNVGAPVTQSKQCNPRIILNLRRTPNGKIVRRSFYFKCEACFVETFTPEKITADLCFSCRPLMGKNLNNFEKIINSENQSIYFCGCESCIALQTESCQTTPCNLCTTPRSLNGNDRNNNI